VAPAAKAKCGRRVRAPNTCEIDFTQHDDLLRFAHGNRRKYKCASPTLQ
jgi:hypothetical protein